MENIEDVISGSFRFKQYSSYKSEVEEFENTLDKFGEFEVYESFAVFLEENEHFREDEEGNLFHMNEILTESMDEVIFSEFIEKYINMDDYNRIGNLNDVAAPILYGEVNADHEVKQHFILLDTIEYCGQNEPAVRSFEPPIADM
jgi:hypothetical protein